MTPGLLLLNYGLLKCGGFRRGRALPAALAAGALAAFPAALIESVLTAGLPPFLSPYVHALGISAIASTVEETAEFAIVLLALSMMRRAAAADIVQVALGASLGFAATENIAAVLLSGGSHGWTGTLATRSLTAVLEHGAIGLIMGCLVAIGRSRHGSAVIRVAALCSPVVLHLLYDFPLSLQGQFHAAAGLTFFWLLTLGASSMLAVWLCNRVLPALRHGLAGQGPLAGPGAMLAGGLGIIAAATIAGITMTLRTAHVLPLAFAFAAGPYILGGDLVLVALSTRRRMVPSPSGTSA